MKRSGFLTLLAIVMILPAKAQSSSFLNTPADASDMAMGGISAVHDAASVLDETIWNADVSYYRWAPKGVGSNLINADLSYRLNKIGLLAEFRSNGYGQYPVTDLNGTVSEHFKPAEHMAGIGAAYAVTPDLAVSLLAKYIGCNLAPQAKASAFAADLNVIYRLKNLKLGLYAANLGTKLSFSGSETPLPMFLKLGAVNDFSFGEKFVLTAGLDAGYLSQGQNKSVIVSAGLDMKMFDIVSVMAGYHFSSDTSFDPSYASAGLGVDIAFVSLDAAYLISSSPIGNTLGITLGFKL